MALSCSKEMYSINTTSIGCCSLPSYRIPTSDRCSIITSGSSNSSTHFKELQSKVTHNMYFSFCPISVSIRFNPTY